MTFQVLGSRVVWEGVLSTARVDELRMPSGETAEREVVEHVDAVAIVALTGDDEVVLLRQYRHPLTSHLLELPAGILDVQGEEPVDAAVRELAEEAAMTVESAEPVLRFANSAGWTDEHTTIFVGRGARPTSRPDDFDLEHEEADMEVRVVPLTEALAMVRRGDIVDAKTVIGLLAVDGRG